MLPNRCHILITVAADDLLKPEVSGSSFQFNLHGGVYQWRIGFIHAVACVKAIAQYADYNEFRNTYQHVNQPWGCQRFISMPGNRFPIVIHFINNPLFKFFIGWFYGH